MERHRQPDKSVGLIEACSKNVVVFASHMLGVRLYAWQVKWLADIQTAIECRAEGKDFVPEHAALTSRQIGKSTAFAILSLWVTVFNKIPATIHNNTVVGITSASDVQAKKLLYEMKKLIRMGDRYMEKTYVNDSGPLFGKDFFTNLLDVNEPNNTTTITFVPHNPKLHGNILLSGSDSGSVIKSYAPTSVVLGETFSLVGIDEAGKSERITDQFFYDYIYPTGNSTNAIRVYTSTPWESSGFFYRMVDPDQYYGDTPCNVSAFTIDAIKEENPDYYKTVMRTVTQMQKDGKTDEVARAYYVRFVKGEKSFFTPESVFDMFVPDMVMHDTYPYPCDMGIDFGGQVNSHTVITVSELSKEGFARRLFHKKYPIGEDLHLESDVERLTKLFNIQRMIVDDCPAGHYFINKLRDKYDLTAMNFRSEKVKKYTAFRTMLSRGKIFSYPDDELKTQMLALEYGHGHRQSVIRAPPGYKDDDIDSFLLSVYYFLEDNEKVEFYSTGDYGPVEDKEYDSGCPQCGFAEFNKLRANTKQCKGCLFEWHDEK